MQKIIIEGNVGGKWSEKKMKGEDGLKTVECLRGRLLAEREASRNAKEETHQLENKLIELEALLKEEIKSRNRAERKLKFLMKKLENSNISSVSKNLDQIVSKDGGKSSKKCDNSAEETLDFVSDACFVEFMTLKYHSEESTEKENSSMGSSNSEKSVLQSTRSSQGSECAAMEEESISSSEVCCGKSSEIESSGFSDTSNTDDHSLKTSKEDEEFTGACNNEGDDPCVDNSKALVSVDIPNTKTELTINAAVLDATVKDVLDSLQRVKEKLQISMEQGRMIRVG